MKPTIDYSQWMGPIQLLPYQPPKRTVPSQRKPALMKKLARVHAPKTRDEAYPAGQHHASEYVEAALRLNHQTPEFLNESTEDALDRPNLALEYTTPDGKTALRHPQVGGALELLEYLEDQLEAGEITMDEALELMEDFTSSKILR